MTSSPAAPVPAAKPWDARPTLKALRPEPEVTASPAPRPVASPLARRSCSSSFQLGQLQSRHQTTLFKGGKKQASVLLHTLTQLKQSQLYLALKRVHYGPKQHSPGLFCLADACNPRQTFSSVTNSTHEFHYI